MLETVWINAGWAKLALGPIEYMPPETLRAVLNRRQPNQHSRSSAGDMFSSSDMLGVLLWRLGKGQLPFRASNKLSSTLAPKTAVKRAKKIATMHDKWKVSNCHLLTMQSKAIMTALTIDQAQFLLACAKAYHRYNNMSHPAFCLQTVRTRTLCCGSVLESCI